MGEETQGTSFREGAARSINGGRKGHILVNCFRSWFYILLRRFEESPYSRRMPNARFDDLRQFEIQNCALLPGEHAPLRRHLPPYRKRWSVAPSSTVRIGFKTTKIGG